MIMLIIVEICFDNKVTDTYKDCLQITLVLQAKEYHSQTMTVAL